MNLSLSIIICTYNRIDLLSLVLEDSLRLIEKLPIELLVIDNNSKDDTASYIQEIASNNNQVRYVFEKNQGLSHARNRGVKEANSEWILFLDDDALPAQNLFQKLMLYIENKDQLIVGGHYSAWYHYGQRKWSKDAYYSNYPSISEKTFLEGDKYLSGGLLLIHKSLFDLVGFFNVTLGMIGDKIGYSEETEFQMRLKNQNVQLLYDPELKMKHVVAEQKLNIDWFFKSKKALAKALYQTRYKGKYHNIIALPLLAFFQAGFLGLKNLFKLISPQYYFQNFVIDTFTKPYKWITIWKQYFKSN